MMATKPILVLFTLATEIFAISLREQLNHINEIRRSSLPRYDKIPTRRVFTFNRYEGGPIIGVPSRSSHLPAAEPILPGHTLLRPALGMLKSAIKFPHRENENGEGVYGHIDNLGIRYDGKNERVLYTGFRRMFSDDKKVDRREVSYSSAGNPKIIYILLTEDSDTERKNAVRRLLLNILRKFSDPVNNRKNSRNYVTNKGNKNTYVALNQTKKLYYSRRDDNNTGNKLYLKNIESEVTEKPEAGVSSHEAAKDNKKWFWKSKDMFDHKQIAQEAPEYNVFLPSITEETRNWSFFGHVKRK